MPHVLLSSAARLILAAAAGVLAAAAVAVSGAGAATVTTATTTTTTTGTPTTTSTTTTTAPTTTTATAPVVPAGDAAIVNGVPISIGTLDHWMYVAEKGNAAEDGGPVIVPTDAPTFTGCIAQARAKIPAYRKTPAKILRSDCAELFHSLSTMTLDFLIKAQWYTDQATGLGFTVTPTEIQTLFAAAQRVTFPTAKDLKAFLKLTGETLADIRFRLAVNKYYSDLLARDTRPVTAAEEMAYYTRHEQGFSHPQVRDVRVIRMRTRATALEARAARAHGMSWTAVVRAYGETPTTANALRTDISAQVEPRAVSRVIFSAPVGALKGPIHAPDGWYLIEVTQIIKAHLASFASVSTEIKELLTSQHQTAALTAVDASTRAAFRASTACAPPYASTDCRVTGT